MQSRKGKKYSFINYSKVLCEFRIHFKDNINKNRRLFLEMYNELDGIPFRAMNKKKKIKKKFLKSLLPPLYLGKKHTGV